MMEGWMVFWGLLLAGTLVFYSGLVIYVAIGGLKDIRQMFKSLGDDEPQAGSGQTQDE